ncbi:MAG: ABC transporter ATP-binding protein [Bacteroidia bacterium]|nr:ABC transporter ATP-binding protein [Bacteroidia bacterium]
MSRLFAYLRPYNGQLWFSILSSISNKILDLMPPLLVGWVIDTVRGNPPIWMKELAWMDDVWGQAAFLAFLGVIIFGFESIFEWMFQRGFMRLAQNVQNDLRMETYGRLQSREMAFFESQRTGDTLAILNDDINQLERFLNTGFNDIVQLIVLFLFAGAILFGVSWELALIGMAPLPLILLGSVWYQKLIAPRYRDMRNEVGQMSSRLENNISGISVIKSFTAEKFEYERVQVNSTAYRDANFKVISYSALYIPLIRMLIALGFGGVLLLGSYWVLNGSGILTVGELVLFSMMIQRVLWPVTRLGQTFDNFERAKASAKRVFGLLDTPSAIQDPSKPVAMDRAQGEIEFHQVKFAYQPELPILKGLDLKIAAGETVGIAGTTGSGKSTLIKLLLRYYEVGEGEIRLDGVDLRELRMFDLRKNIALVSQDVYLFHGTIAENIAYGTASAQAEIEHAARMAQLHDFVVSLPKGYQTLVGERGLKLSGGQRQRLSIARAILKNAPVLVLDEATSSVDTETERAIQQNLNRFAEGRTALVIAHRLSTIRNANRIIVLDQGKVAEQGKHEELLEKGGIYADLWKVQIGELDLNGN